MKILSLFDGISTGYLALKEAGITIDTYYASEIDANAISISKYNFPDIIHIGDINGWKNWHIDFSQINLVIGGSPCQSFSNVGNKSGFEGKSGLVTKYFEILDHIKRLNPNVKFLLENVAMKKEWADAISEQLCGVAPVSINSCLFSAQNRKRLYWCNWELPVLTIKGNETVLKDILDSDDGKHFLSYKHWQAFLKNYNWKDTDINGKCKTLLASYYKQPPHSPYIKSESSPSGYRRLTPRECEKLQTLPIDFTKYGLVNGVAKEMSETARYKAIGNGWTMKTIKWIFEQMKENFK